MIASETTSDPQRDRGLPWLVFAAVLAVRLAVFPFAKNFYGDPVMRLKALSAWMAHPFFLWSFRGAHQFGPLHLYLLALGQWIHPDLDGGPRLISLAFGSLTAFPLFRLAERRFGTGAAVLSTLGLAVYSLHIQASTTAASEAVFLWFLLAALSMLDRAVEGSASALVMAGLAMAGACAVRYDGWLYAPLTWIWLVEPLRSRRLPWSAAAGYAAASLAIPALMCLGNWVELGDPLYTLRFIQENHAQSAAGAAIWMGRWRYAAYCLAFWPANLAWELSPPIALGVAVGVGAALRGHRGRDLLALAAVPAALFSCQGALLRFHPLARFTMPAGLLLLPYAGDGLLRTARALARRWKPAAALAAIATGLGLPAYLAWRTLGRGDSFADTLRPISPVSNLPPDLSAAASWLKANGADRKVEIETNWLYEELPIEFYGGGSTSALFTPREGAPPEGFEPPDLVVLPKDSDLIRSGAGRLQGGVLESGGRRFAALAHFGKVTIYSRLAE